VRLGTRPINVSLFRDKATRDTSPKLEQTCKRRIKRARAPKNIISGFSYETSLEDYKAVIDYFMNIKKDDQRDMLM
jgi:hypothetical protein